MSTLMRSGGTIPPPGKSISDQVERALYLRNLAEGALDAAYESQWIDATLAEAALVSFHCFHIYAWVSPVT